MSRRRRPAKRFRPTTENDEENRWALGEIGSPPMRRKPPLLGEMNAVKVEGGSLKKP